MLCFYSHSDPYYKNCTSLLQKLHIGKQKLHILTTKIAHKHPVLNPIGLRMAKLMMKSRFKNLLYKKKYKAKKKHKKI